MTEELEDDDEDGGETPNKRPNPADHLRPWQFKPGNKPGPGRPPGSVSLKEYAKKMMKDMTDEEKAKFLEGLNKKDIWEMAEGKAESNSNVAVKGDLTVKLIAFDEFNNDTPQPQAEQG